MIAARVSDLKVHYPLRRGLLDWGKPPRSLKAVDGVSFDLKAGETLGLVGESGCGKSSLGKAILRLVRSTSGQVEIADQDFLALKRRDLKQARSAIQMIFQDPYGSLDPRMPVFDLLAEPLRAHRALWKGDLSNQIYEALDTVGLPRKAIFRYPHEFSGGQRQRIAIARALILRPKVLIADEPVSSLDVSVQAQILNLLKEVKERFGLSMIFISHNLAIVKYISDRIAVMYLGKIVELAGKEEIYRAPKHPYTQALVSAVPIPDPRKERNRVRISLKGELPSPINPPRGCAFQTRCPIATDRCRVETPALEELQPGWKVSCFEAKK